MPRPCQFWGVSPEIRSDHCICGTQKDPERSLKRQEGSASHEQQAGLFGHEAAAAPFVPTERVLPLFDPVLNVATPSPENLS
jgi:hypothetical protein